MLMNQILDSSDALHDPDERSRPLKRSASVASLPTPPRTHHKRSRSRARSSLSCPDSDGSGSASELDGDFRNGYAGRFKRAKTSLKNKSVIDDDDDDEEHSEAESPERKKRRTLGVLPGHDEEEDENAFWTGRSGPPCGEKREKEVEADKTEESSPSPALLRYRVKAPVSPPPSRRPPSIQPVRATSVERDGSSIGFVAPVTPPHKLLLRAPSPSVADAFRTPTKVKATKIWPRRDSPNNPFLIDSDQMGKLRSEWDSSDEEEEEVVGEARVQEGTPTPTYEEKPTITYVFRGQKATFHNPLYTLAPEVIAASKLPVDHPDYEAAEACPPKRLFVSPGKRKSQDRNRKSTSMGRAKVQRSADDHDETSEGEQDGTGAESHKKLSLSDVAEAETVPIEPAYELSSRPVDDEELQGARVGRERREMMTKARLASRDGLRAGAVFAERDEPARRAMGPLRSA